MLSNSVADSLSEEVLHRALKGDDRAYEQLLTHPDHQQRLQRIARKQTYGTSLGWEDAVQDAHLKVLRALKAGKFRQGDLADFYRWATTVARYEVIDRVRQSQRHPRLSLDQPLSQREAPLLETIADPFDVLAAVERADLILRAIEAITLLDQRYPERGYLILWQGLIAEKPQAQIAAELEISQGAVSKRWKELTQRVAAELDLLPSDAIESEVQQLQAHSSTRSRSTVQW